MSIAIIIPDRDISTFLKELKASSKEHLIVNPSPSETDKIDIAILWNHPPGTIASFPNLKLICSFGAGVDHITSDPEYHPSIPVTRIVDEGLTQSMTRYIVAAVSMFQYGFHFKADHDLGFDYMKKPLYSPELSVGILGLGALGEASAKYCSQLGYEVLGISRGRKEIEGVDTFALSEMNEFLLRTNILVCMLPLTTETKGIIDFNLLNKLKKPSFFINVGRGQHVIEKELIEAIQQEVVLGACLDVVRNEPISTSDPLASESRIIITPHIASITDQVNAASIISDNIRRFRNGQVMMFSINPDVGY